MSEPCDRSKAGRRADLRKLTRRIRAAHGKVGAMACVGELIRNVHAQAMVAQWQDALRCEQHVLLSRLRGALTQEHSEDGTTVR